MSQTAELEQTETDPFAEPPELFDDADAESVDGDLVIEASESEAAEEVVQEVLQPPVNQYVPKGGKFRSLGQSVLVGGDMTPDLTDNQVKLIRLQQEDYDLKRLTKGGTENVYEGINLTCKNPIEKLDQAFGGYTREQAAGTAAFLARQTGKRFFIVADQRRPGGFLSVPEAKANFYIENNLVVDVIGDAPAPKPAKQRRKGVQPPAPEPAAVAPETETAPVQAIPEPGTAGRELAEFDYSTGTFAGTTDKTVALADHSTKELREGGWPEEVVQLVRAAVAQGIIHDDQSLFDVIVTAKGVRFVEDGKGTDLAAFAEAILYQQKGGAILYLEALKAETDELVALNSHAGSEQPAGIGINLSIGRRVTSVIAAAGKELPPPEEKKKRRKATAKDKPAPYPAAEPYGIYEVGTPDFDQNAKAIDARREADETGVSEEDKIAGGYYKNKLFPDYTSPVQCSRCPEFAAKTVTTKLFGVEHVCTACADALERDRQAVADSFGEEDDPFA